MPDVLETRHLDELRRGAVVKETKPPKPVPPIPDYSEDRYPGAGPDPDPTTLDPKMYPQGYKPAPLGAGTVIKTSGVDKYIVREQIPDQARGEYTQSLKTAAEVRAMGLNIPESLSKEATAWTPEFEQRVAAIAKTKAAKATEVPQHLTVGVDTKNPVKIENSPDIQALKKTDPELYAVLKDKGIDAYNRVRADRTAEYKKTAALYRIELKSFRDRHAELPDGEYISKVELRKIKDEHPALYGALMEGGFAAAGEYLTEAEAEYLTARAKYEKNQLALSMLATKYMDDEGRVDVKQYLADNPKDTNTLNNAGITDKQIKEAMTPSYIQVPAATKWDDVKETLTDAGKVKGDATEAEVRKEWELLSSVEKMKLIEQSPATRRTRFAMSEVAVGFVPVAGTIYYWDRMSGGERALSITGDVLFFAAPYILRGVVRSIRGLKNTTTYQRMVTGMDDSLKVVKKTTPEIYGPTKAVVQAQAQYTDDIVKVKQLEQTIAQTDDILRNKKLAPGTVQYDAVADIGKAARQEIAGATNAIELSAVELKKAATNYANSWRAIYKVPAESQPYLLSLPDDIVRHTRQVIDAATSPGAVKIADLEADLVAAIKRLTDVRNRYPTNPAAWTDVTGDVSKIQAEIQGARLGGIQEGHIKLVASREAADILERLVKDARIARSPYLADLETELARVRTVIGELEIQLTKNIKAMEITIGDDAGLSQGGRTVVASPPQTGAASVAAESELAHLLRTSTADQAARLLGLTAFPDVKAKTLPSPTEIPQAIPQPTPTSTPEPYPMTVTTPEPSAKPKGKPKAIKGPAIVDEPTAAPGPGEEPDPTPQTTPAPTPEPTPQPVPEPTPEPTPPPDIPVTEPPPEEPPPTAGVVRLTPGAGATEEEKYKFIEESEGAVGWKQGILSGKIVKHIVVKPYSEKTHFVLLDEVPPNVEMKDTAREAYATITQLHGEGPDRPVRLEGGIADPVIFKRGGKTAITFTPDKPRRRRGVNYQNVEVEPGIVETRRGKKTIRRRARL